jgi:hypothetical protein
MTLAPPSVNLTLEAQCSNYFKSGAFSGVSTLAQASAISSDLESAASRSALFS